MSRVYLTGFIFFCIISCSKKTEQQPTTEQDNPVVAATDTVTSSTANFKGVNWADPRDNFTDDWLILSGTSSTDDQATIDSKAEKVLSALQSKGVNTVRLPVNPPTVLQTWWPRYSSIVRKASAKGMKVILAYWEAASSKDGKVDNTTQFWLMWDKVIAGFSNNANVYFEIFNEPHGYSADELKSLYAEWLSKYPTLPKRRIILDGTGYATDVNVVGDDTRFDGCLLSFHFYSWFSSAKTISDWEAPLLSIRHAKRTIMTEFGVPMTNGKDYLARPGSDVEITYFQGISNQLHDLSIGGIYWPGVRTGDTYSMFNFDGNTLQTNNTSGFTRLQYAWGIGTVDPFYANFTAGTYYRAINRNSNKALDVNGGSTSNGGNIIQWDYSGGANQQWTFNSLGNGYFSIINKNSNKSLDVNGASTSAGTGIIQWDYSGGPNQQWRIYDIGFGFYKIYNKNSGQALDVNGGSTNNGANVIQWYWNQGGNQQWLIATP